MTAMLYECTNQDISELLRNKPLYAKLKANTVTGHNGLAYNAPNDLFQKPFKFLCLVEKDEQTFRTQPPIGSHLFPRSYREDHNAEDVPEYFDEKTGKLEQISEVAACCQSCGAIISFLIRRFSDKPWSERASGLTIYLQKVGQFPAFDIQPDKEIQKYLTDEDLDAFKKGLINLSISYGIGAFAYFRRVVENELRRIVKDISELDFDGAEEVKQALATYEINHQMSNLISAAIKHLPASLKINGENPLQLLYQQLSVGIHTLTEEQCLEKAESIKVLFTFMIKKVNEEKYVINDVSQAMKNLRS